MENTTLKQIIVDYSKNTLQKYSKDEASNILRNAVIEMNGNSTVFDDKAFRRNPALYDIVEETLRVSRDSGLKGNEFWNAFVDEITLAEMNANRWIIKKECDLLASDISRGNQAVRRQRLYGNQVLTLTPKPHAIGVYEEWTRLAAGRTDLGDMMDAMSKGMVSARLDDIYSIWSGLTSNDVGSGFYYAGSYAEDSVLGICQKVQAANSAAKVTLVGTQSGVRKLTTGIWCDKARNDMYDYGSIMKWNGLDVMVIPQRFNRGTATFKLDDTILWAIPSDMDSIIKGVSGDVTLKVGDALDNADMTTDIITIDEWAYSALISRTGGLGLIDLT